MHLPLSVSSLAFGIVLVTVAEWLELNLYSMLRSSSRAGVVVALCICWLLLLPACARPLLLHVMLRGHGTK